ncbi:MAG: lysylphosphatidylglycerol synthase transmembrane domain-containing protein [Nitrospira sp.]|nr:lysylphosphatidylglycerol synthase transmembrane domain-containing protein [Nitrospira sp.]
MVKRLLLVIGLFTLAFLVWYIGPTEIYRAVHRLGPAALLSILAPSLLMYLVEGYGWKVALEGSERVPFWRLLMIRMAGEVVNMTTPTAYVGGEPLKAYLLQRDGVPVVEGLASVVIAKTTMTIAQVLFIIVGIAIGLWVLGPTGSSGQIVTGAILSVGLLLFGTAAFVLVQRRGLFTWTLELIRKLGWRLEVLERRAEQLRSLDRTILNFYTERRLMFYISTGLYLLGWLAEAIEVYVIIYCLGGPADMLSAVSIGALSVLIKGGTFFIPGSLGAQDAGNLLLLRAFGYSEVVGVAFALLRRFRELVWISVGLLCLALIGKPGGSTNDA